MSGEKVWLRFEKKKKDGTEWKLRIQDLPADRIDEVIELMLKYFIRDEIVHKATDIHKNPEAVETYRHYLYKIMHAPTSHVVICCEDEAVVGDIIGVSIVLLTTEDFNWEEVLEIAKESGSQELKKLTDVLHSNSKLFQPMKELNLSLYLEDQDILVVPVYRGHGLAEQFLKTRRIMCAALDAPKTGGWMTGHGTQIAAARDGWETVFEIKYDDLARDHGLVFEDAPVTMKYMVALPLEE